MRTLLFLGLFLAGSVTLLADIQPTIAQAEEKPPQTASAGEARQTLPKPESVADGKEVLRLEKLLQDAWLKHDGVTVSGIVAEDFESWSFKGKRRGKAELLKGVEKNREVGTKVEDERVRVFGDTAVYTARFTDSAKDEKGASFDATTVVTAVFVRREGKWLLVQNHDSLIQK